MQAGLPDRRIAGLLLSFLLIRSARGLFDARLLVFAKAPQPGRVKTRLVPPLTFEDAALLHRELLSRTLARLAADRLVPIELWCAPNPTFPVFADLAERYGLTLHRQSDGDIGERMYQALREGLRRCRRLVIVGSDCPLLDRDYATAALAVLDAHDAVIGPAEDGGYVLLGARDARPELFADIPWGTNAVAQLTRERMATLNWKWAELPTLWDLDRPEDLARYRALRLVESRDGIPARLNAGG